MIAPTSELSLSIGTATVDRAPPSLAALPGFICRVVGATGHFPCLQNAIEEGSRFGPIRPPLSLQIGESRRRANAGRTVNRLAVVAKQYAELGLADAHSAFQHGLEYRLQFSGRRTDHAQYLGGGGLLLQ